MKRHAARSKIARIEQIVPLYERYIAEKGTANGVHTWLAERLHISESTTAQSISLWHRIQDIAKETDVDVWNEYIKKKNMTSAEMHEFIDKYKLDSARNKEELEKQEALKKKAEVEAEEVKRRRREAMLRVAKMPERIKEFEALALRKSNEIKGVVGAEIVNSGVGLDQVERAVLFESAYKDEMMVWLKTVEKEYRDVIEHKKRKGELLFSTCKNDRTSEQTVRQATDIR